MTATIIPFPSRPRRADIAQHVGQIIRDTYSLPPRDPELELLMAMAESLLSNITEPGVDRFLDRLALWEERNRAG